jgi:hypothetical protein
MGLLMAHIAHQPGQVCVEGDVSRWLAGVVGGGFGVWGVELLGAALLHQRCHSRLRLGALL